VNFFLTKSIGSLWQAVKRWFRQWAKPTNDTMVLNAILDMTSSRWELMLENALLRQQVIVLQRQIKRPKLNWRDRALFVLLSSKLRSWRQALVIVQPDTVLRWHRDLFQWVWKRRSKSKGKQGRLPLTDDIVTLIKHIAKENLTWGAERIRGELLKLGVRVSKSAIQKYMNDTRQSRTSKQTWATFLRNQRSVLTVSTVLDGEYGLEDVCLSVPCVVSQQGVERIVEANLSPEESEALSRSASVLREAVATLSEGRRSEG
jgi:hypothetical protein